MLDLTSEDVSGDPKKSKNNKILVALSDDDESDSELSTPKALTFAPSSHDNNNNNKSRPAAVDVPKVPSSSSGVQKNQQERQQAIKLEVSSSDDDELSTSKAGTASGEKKKPSSSTSSFEPNAGPVSGGGAAVAAIVNKYSASVSSGTNSNIGKLSQQQQPNNNNNVLPPPIAASLERDDKENSFNLGNNNNNNHNPQAPRRRSVAFSPLGISTEESPSAAAQKKSETKNNLGKPINFTEDQTATFNVASRRPSVAVAPGGTANNNNNNNNGMIILRDEGLEEGEELSDPVSFTLPGDGDQQRQKSPSFSLARRKSSSSARPLEDVGLGDESEFNLFSYPEFSLALAGHEPHSFTRLKTFDEEEKERKEKEAAELAKKHEKERLDKLLLFKQKQEGLLTKLGEEAELLTSEQEPAERNVILQEYAKSIPSVLFNSLITQQWFLICRQVFENENILKPRKQMEDERDGLIEHTCIPLWIQIFKKVVQENRKKLEAVVEPDHRLDSIILAEVADRRRIYKDFSLLQSADDERKKRHEEYNKKMVKLSGVDEVQEREKFVAEFNFAVVALSTQKQELFRKHQRSIIERQETAERNTIDDEFFDKESDRILPNILEFHRQLKIKNRANMETDFKEKMKKEIVKEHKKMIDSFVEDLRRAQRSQLEKLEILTEPPPRSAIEENRQKDLEQMKQRERSEFAIYAAKLSQRQQLQFVEDSHQKNLVELWKDFMTIAQQNIFFPFQRNRIELSENETRKKSLRSSELSERRSNLHPIMNEIQKLRRLNLEKKEENERNENLIHRQYQQDFVDRTIEEILKLHRAAKIHSELHLLQFQTEPSARRQIQEQDETTNRDSVIHEPFKKTAKAIFVKEETQRAERAKRNQQSLGVIENEESTARREDLANQRDIFLQNEFRPQFIKSFQQAQVTEFLRYSEPPARNKIIAEESQRMTQTLIPAMNLWHQQHRNSFFEDQFAQNFYKKQLVPEMETFFRATKATEKNQLQLVFESTKLFLVQVHEPKMRQENLVDSEQQERTKIMTVFSNGIRFLARNILAKKEEKARIDVIKAREVEFTSRFISLKILLVAEETARFVIKKFENNIAETFFAKDAVLLKIKAGMHFISLQQEPNARALLLEDERVSFVRDVLEPHENRKLMAQSTALAREHKQHRDTVIISEYETTSKQLFSRLQKIWTQVRARTILQKDEERKRLSEIYRVAESEFSVIEQEYEHFIKTVMKSIYERRLMEKQVVQSAATEVFMPELAEFAQLVRDYIDQSQYILRRCVIAVRMFHARKLLFFKNMSIESDKAMILLKHEERWVLFNYQRGQYLFALTKKRIETTEKLHRTEIVDKYISERASQFFGNKFHGLENSDEPEARAELLLEERGKAFLIISEHIFRAQSLARGSILNEHYETGFRRFRQESENLEFLHHEYYEARDRMKNYETRAFCVMMGPAIQHQETIHRKMIADECEAEFWNDIWVENSADLLCQNELATRHALEQEQRDVFFSSLCIPQLVKSEQSIRFALDEFVQHNERQLISFLMQEDGIHVWDTLIRHSIADQWASFFFVLARLELCRRAPIALHDEVCDPESRERQRDIDFAQEQDKLYASAFEEKNRFLLREELIRADRCSNEFFCQVEADYDGIVALEAKERLENIKFAAQQNKFFSTSSKNLRGDYEQGISDLTLIFKWELSNREEIVRRENIIDVEKSERKHELSEREDRMFLEARHLEKRTILFRESILCPAVIELLMWMRNVDAEQNITQQESRARSLLAANFGLTGAVQSQEESSRRQIFVAEHEQRYRLCHHIFDSWSIGFNLNGQIYELERMEREKLFIAFNVGRTERKETYHRKNQLVWEARKSQTDLFIHVLSSMEIIHRDNILKTELFDRKNTLKNISDNLSLQAAEDFDRNIVVILRGWKNNFLGIAREELENRIIVSRTVNVAKIEQQERRNLFLLSHASGIQATMELNRKSVRYLENQMWNELRRSELFHRSQQLKFESCDHEVEIKMNRILSNGYSVFHEKDQPGEKDNNNDATQLSNLEDDGFIATNFGDLQQEWKIICKLQREKLHQEMSAGEARDREYYVTGFASTKFAQSKGLPQKYEELYSSQMSKPSELMREHRGETDQPLQIVEVLDKNQFQQEQEHENHHRKFLPHFSDKNNDNNQDNNQDRSRAFNSCTPIPALLSHLSRPGTAQNPPMTRPSTAKIFSNSVENNNNNILSRSSIARNKIYSPTPTLPPTCATSMERPRTASHQNNQQQRIGVTSKFNNNNNNNNNNNPHQLFYRPSSSSGSAKVVIAKRSSSPEDFLPRALVPSRNGKNNIEELNNNNNNNERESTQQELFHPSHPHYYDQRRPSLLPVRSTTSNNNNNNFVSFSSSSRPSTANNNNNNSRLIFVEDDTSTSDDDDNNKMGDDDKNRNNNNNDAVVFPMKNVAKSARALQHTFDEFHYSRPTSACPGFNSSNHFHNHNNQNVNTEAPVLSPSSSSTSEHQKTIQKALFKGANFLKQVAGNIESMQQQKHKQQSQQQNTDTQSATDIVHDTNSKNRANSPTKAKIWFNSGLDTDFAIPGGTGEVLIEATRNRLNKLNNNNNKFVPTPPSTPPPVQQHQNNSRSSGGLYTSVSSNNTVKPLAPPVLGTSSKNANGKQTSKSISVEPSVNKNKNENPSNISQQPQPKSISFAAAPTIVTQDDFFADDDDDDENNPIFQTQIKQQNVPVLPTEREKDSAKATTTTTKIPPPLQPQNFASNDNDDDDDESINFDDSFAI